MITQGVDWILVHCSCIKLKMVCGSGTTKAKKILQQCHYLQLDDMFNYPAKEKKTK